MATTAPAAVSRLSSPFRLVDNRVFLPGTLNGKGPYSFLLDTGADGWAVSTTLAHRLAIPQGKAERIAGAGEAKETLHHLKLQRVDLAGLSFSDQRALSADFSDLDAVIGFQHFDGIAGKPVFDAYVVDLDFGRARVRFFSPAEYSPPADAKVMPFELYQTIPVIDGEIAGIKGRFLVDLGDRSSLTLFGPFWRAHHLDRVFGPGIIAITGYGLGGPVKGELVRVPEFTMAGIRVAGIVARLSLQKAGVFNTSAIAGSIGTGILKRFNVTFDYPGRRIFLQEAPSQDVPDEADRSGLWLGRSGDDFEVFGVVSNSRAARSGIKKGDIVTAIDGVPTKRLDLFAIREQLKSPGRKSDSFTIKEGSHSKVVTVALHDLIPRN
ncbi:MAG TPA: aspartyl protease family protein [Steroidobacteraceae bacterium]|nr:aspartyl protease family protein [Steroidobacteraceae bacterium]